ncbi:hypothetical protein DPMN_036119, partial [Dreissena polymorpha]
ASDGKRHEERHQLAREPSKNPNINIGDRAHRHGGDDGFGEQPGTLVLGVGVATPDDGLTQHLHEALMGLVIRINNHSVNTLCR